MAQRLISTILYLVPITNKGLAMSVFSTEPLRPSDHPLLHTWTSKLFGVRTANFSSSGQTISLGITSANLQYGTAAVVARAGGTGQENIWFNRVLGSTLAGDRIDFSGLDSRSMFVGYSPTSPLGVNVNLATGSVVIGSVTSAGSTVSWGCLVQNFEDVTGSAFDDILIGNADSNKILGGAGNDTLDGGAGVDVLTGGSGNDQFTLANRGGFNADSITDFKAYIVRSQPGSPAGPIIEDDALILANRLDEGLVGASAAGIKGLTFSGGNGVGNTLASTSFFKGDGMNGASFGAAAGIFVNTSSGDVFYNDAKEAGSYLIARLGSAGVAGITVRRRLGRRVRATT
jgi:Ca2+-binding RTX toxin-like protein